jgi:hypothetical protein
MDHNNISEINSQQTPIPDPTPEPELEPTPELPLELTLEEKVKKIKKILKDYSYNYDEPSNPEIIPKIYDLFINNLVDDALEDGDYYTYLGFYYASIKDDKYLTKKYYLQGIEKNNVHAMYNYALLCEDIDDYSEMKKFFKMAIHLGDVESMTSLGYYYYNIDNYDKMKKYYLMAIEKGSTDAMIHLGHYYLVDKEKEEKGIRFYDMAIKNKNYKAYFELANYYNTKKDFDKCKEYYLLYFENSDDEDYIILGISSLINIIITNEKEIDFLIPYVKKYELSMLKINEYLLKIQLRKQFMINKKKYTKNDTCAICFEDNELLIYDCFAHYICEKCYNQYDKCPFCFIEKHQLMTNKNKYELSVYSDDENNDDEFEDDDIDDDIDDEIDDEINDELDDTLDNTLDGALDGALEDAIDEDNIEGVNNEEEDNNTISDDSSISEP